MTVRARRSSWTDTGCSVDGDRVRYKRGRQDSCVASYNSVLLARYQTHINVDIAATARVVAYIRKYMCKVRVVCGVRDANPRLL